MWGEALRIAQELLAAVRELTIELREHRTSAVDLLAELRALRADRERV